MSVWYKASLFSFLLAFAGLTFTVYSELAYVPGSGANIGAGFGMFGAAFFWILSVLFFIIGIFKK